MISAFSPITPLEKDQGFPNTEMWVIKFFVLCNRTILENKNLPVMKNLCLYNNDCYYVTSITDPFNIQLNKKMMLLFASRILRYCQLIFL